MITVLCSGHVDIEGGGNQSSPTSDKATDCRRTVRVELSEPTFSLAAVPKERPRLEDLQDTYEVGDYMTATCTSAPGDPKPHLSFFVNHQQVQLLTAIVFVFGKNETTTKIMQISKAFVSECSSFKSCIFH